MSILDGEFSCRRFSSSIAVALRASPHQCGHFQKSCAHHARRVLISRRRKGRPESKILGEFSAFKLCKNYFQLSSHFFIVDAVNRPMSI
jgi:hypothetical protein